MPADEVTITQEADTFSRTPGNRFPYKPTYRIEYPGMPTTHKGHPVPAVYTSRAEARSFGKAKARAAGVPVREVGFR